MSKRLISRVTIKNPAILQGSLEMPRCPYYEQRFYRILKSGLGVSPVLRRLGKLIKSFISRKMTHSVSARQAFLCAKHMYTMFQKAHPRVSQGSIQSNDSSTPTNRETLQSGSAQPQDYTVSPQSNENNTNSPCDVPKYPSMSRRRLASNKPTFQGRLELPPSLCLHSFSADKANPSPACSLLATSGSSPYLGALSLGIRKPDRTPITPANQVIHQLHSPPKLSFPTKPNSQCALSSPLVALDSAGDSPVNDQTILVGFNESTPTLTHKTAQRVPYVGPKQTPNPASMIPAQESCVVQRTIRRPLLSLPRRLSYTRTLALSNSHYRSRLFPLEEPSLASPALISSNYGNSRYSPLDFPSVLTQSIPPCYFQH